MKWMNLMINYLIELLILILKKNWIYLKRKKKKEFFENNIKYLFSGCACTCAFVFWLIMLTRNEDKNAELFQEKDFVRITNPVNEVKSVSEIEKTIGLSVPVLEKKVDSY